MLTNDGPSAAQKSLVLAAMTAANAMVLVDQTAVPLTLPDIMSHFAVGSQLVQWVLNGSLLSLAAFLVLGGQLGDRFGRRRVFLIGTLVFAAASACAGLSPQFGLLIVFRALQGLGGALMLPTTVAIVSNVFSGAGRGAALGTMGGLAAVAGAAGPVVGGLLDVTLGWQAVFLINVPLAVVAAGIAWRAVPRDDAHATAARMDTAGTVLLAVAIIAFIGGLGQIQSWGLDSVLVWSALAVALGALVAFVLVERRLASPLIDFTLLRRARGYRTAVISQLLAGMAEMGLGVILPLLLILNLQLSPGLAGLALLPASVPLVIIAPLVGRWYDRSGARPPMVTGYAALAAAGVLLAFGGFHYNYWFVLPGLLLYGGGLAVVLTVNDPVSLSDVPDPQQGEAAGVAATAEQFGGALGIAVLYLIFHLTYVAKLNALVDDSTLADLDAAQLARLKQDLLNAETTGLRPETFDPELSPYLRAAGLAASWGYAAAFATVTLLGILGAALILRSRISPASPTVSADPP